MIDTIASAVARERRLDLLRAAGCCTARIEHRRALASAAGRRLKFSLRRPRAMQPFACCA
jgi:hypothetical protein